MHPTSTMCGLLVSPILMEECIRSGWNRTLHLLGYFVWRDGFHPVRCPLERHNENGCEKACISQFRFALYVLTKSNASTDQYARNKQDRSMQLGFSPYGMRSTTMKALLPAFLRAEIGGKRPSAVSNTSIHHSTLSIPRYNDRHEA